MAINLNARFQPEERGAAVVAHAQGLLVVNAGPGTGKTYSLLRKLEALLKQGIPPHRIYYLTFVNSIVSAFKADVEKPKEKGGLGDSVEALGIKVTTLHSLAFKIIRTFASQLGMPKHVELTDFAETTDSALARVALDDVFTIVRLTEPTYSRITFNNNMRLLRRIWQTDLGVPQELGHLVGSVDALERLYQVLPWDRLVPRANASILRHGLPAWLKDATHFLVDEFQDFNPSEQRFIELITQPSDSVVVVGDKDQSIYSGRSASPIGLETLLARPDANTVNFVLCRRCPTSVVAGANKVLELIDPDGFASRKLTPHKTDAGRVVVKEFKSCKAEIDYLAEQFGKWGSRGIDLILVLFPTRKALEFYRAGFEKRSVVIAQDLAGGDDLLRVMLRLAVFRGHPFLERVMVHQYPRIERRFVEDALPLILRDSLSPMKALEEASEHSRWQKPVRDEYSALQEEINHLCSGSARRVADACAGRGYSVSSVELSDLLAPDQENEASERIERIAKESGPAVTSSKPLIRLMTIHSSKGLSAPVVVMPAMEDRWMPGAAEADALAEKHRLFYVALTRAERGVLITYPRTRGRGDPLNYLPDRTSPGASRYARLLT